MSIKIGTIATVVVFPSPSETFVRIYCVTSKQVVSVPATFDPHLCMHLPSAQRPESLREDDREGDEISK